MTNATLTEQQANHLANIIRKHGARDDNGLMVMTIATTMVPTEHHQSFIKRCSNINAGE